MQTQTTQGYLTDHLGSIRTTIDHFGNVIGYDDYYPFGLPMTGRSSNLGNTNDLNKFTGHERDNEGGLMIDYMLARNYDPEIGRFMSVDPLANKFPAWSPYNYTMGNPLRFIDPDGNAPKYPFKITVRTYIPYSSVLGFKGDSRLNSTATNVSYRTSHTVGVETNPSVSQNPQTFNDGGKTGITMTTVGIPTTYLRAFGKADEGKDGGFSATVSRNGRNGGDNAVLNFEGSSFNPLAPGAGAIDYNFSIEIIPGEDGAAPTIKVNGFHDGFPAYEINVTDQKTGTVYQPYYDEPNGKWELIHLYGESDTEVNK